MSKFELLIGTFQGLIIVIALCILCFTKWLNLSDSTTAILTLVLCNLYLALIRTYARKLPLECK